jgi:hypothetical protein
MMQFKPFIQSVPLAMARQWRGGGPFLYEEKIDGRWTELEHGGSLVVGETVGAQFWPFDVVRIDGQDIRHRTLFERLRALDHVCATAGGHWLRPARGNGGEFLEAVLARGGEGIVAKELDQPYGRGWFKAKRCQVYYCVVTSKGAGGRQTVKLGFADDPNMPPAAGGFQDLKNEARSALATSGTLVSRCQKLQPAGNLALRGEKFDAVRVGSILKVEAFGQHASGLLREARLDRDTPESWLVKW